MLASQYIPESSVSDFFGHGVCIDDMFRLALSAVLKSYFLPNWPALRFCRDAWEGGELHPVISVAAKPLLLGKGKQQVFLLKKEIQMGFYSWKVMISKSKCFSAKFIAPPRLRGAVKSTSWGKPTRSYQKIWFVPWRHLQISQSQQRLPFRWKN